MKTIWLATGNKRKMGEARLACERFDITVKQIKLDIEEIQATDPIVISEYKAERAFEQIKQPVTVTDTFWNIPALNGFPGPYMKYISEQTEDFPLRSRLLTKMPNK